MRSLLFPALSTIAGFASVGLGFSMLGTEAFADDVKGANTTGGTVTGGSVTGGTVTGGSVKGGSVTGSSVTGASVSGGSVKGGTVTGGTVTGGTVTSGTVTSGTVTAGTVGPATATSIVNGREITATVRGSVSIQSEGSSAVVNLDKHKIVVEDDRLVVDGQEKAQLPSRARKIALDATAEQLTVQADGKEILKSNWK
jgi:hypothetical protein